MSACPECQHEKNRHGDDGCLVYINDEDDTYCPCTQRFAPELPPIICRKCRTPIEHGQFRFGSPSTGWSHMEGECVVLSGVTEHMLIVRVEINHDVAQGDELDLVRDHIQEGVDAVDLEAVHVALL